MPTSGQFGLVAIPRQISDDIALESVG